MYSSCCFYDAIPPNMFTSGDLARQFILAGNAYVTFRSTRTGTRFTYNVRVSDDKRLWFVSVLTSPDDYTYIGQVFADRLNFVHGRKSRIGSDAPSVAAFGWVWERLRVAHLPDPSIVEVWHEGRCGRCGRPLTVPESIAAGIGPICAEKGL